MKEKYVTVEMWKDPEIRATLNIVDLFTARDKTQSNDSADTHKLLEENQI
ncbi:MAG: hypothetical protein WA766_04915 [Candidatus Acidiferrales bacterium]|jgi:hypothetical protein